MSDLVSKISASGLSAGVFLLWWPAHVTSQGGDVLLARGVLWAAAFELLLLGFRPLERAVGRAVREREPAVLAPSRIGRILVFAVLAAAVPSVLLSGAHDVVSPARAAAPKVIVKREIVRREVVVRRVSHVVRVPVPVAATTQAKPTAATSAPAAPVAQRRATTAAAAPTRSKPASTATPKPVTTDPAADTKSDIPAATTTTTTAPAATSATAQPSTASAEAPASAAPASASAAATAAAGR
jgi:hypothetical protein